ncbi:OmpA family protein [Aurantiacibacter sp. MUD11]|uniref:OmpA family protein n=1 Tax=Aurantiacibacter sp. MUD11 TaxID=3003265 RepID=UPI0022AA4E92|nr:OmpA family protein [Aurantiacibacter sp. MUD11]WAT17775.1 OmpA family protein [Aurantiacibacter sp. MUD11]
MKFLRKPQVAIVGGMLACVALAYTVAGANAPALADRLAAAAPAAIEAAGGAGQVEAHFRSPNGWPSRHPVLTGGEPLGENTRAAIARAVADIPGVGGIRWSDGDMMVEDYFSPLHCQEDVQALLRARTIRFEEGSARIEAASQSLVDEVARALSPCLGAVIEVTGHTDDSGAEERNLQLSRERAEAVRAALVGRGIPEEALSAKGEGSARPVDGLEPGDPANRRIEFRVISTQPLIPTPVDTPAPR